MFSVGDPCYAYSMNKSETVPTTVRHLQVGDVLAGSGFEVTHNPFTSVRCPKGKLHVEGFYPNGPVKRVTWNASTTMNVVR